MATPMKKHDRIFFMNKDVCVFCSVKSKQRYFIVKADNTKGPAFDLTEQFFQKSIWLNENWKFCVYIVLQDASENKWYGLQTQRFI